MTRRQIEPRLLELEKRGMCEARKQNLELFQKIPLPLGEKATFLKPEGEVVSGICAVNASGHSPSMLLSTLRATTSGC
jgi:hypothetical protein